MFDFGLFGMGWCDDDLAEDPPPPDPPGPYGPEYGPEYAGGEDEP
jgi:hypothetical protein